MPKQLRASWFIAVLLSLSTGCVVGELGEQAEFGADAGPEEVYESAADLEAEDIDSSMVLFDMVDPSADDQVLAGSLRRLRATDANLYKLRNGCYDGGRNLKWSCNSANDGGSLYARKKRQVGTNDTQVADNYGGYWGECVSLVKAVAKNNATTSQWRPGRNVFEGLPAGTAIATFPGGRYSGHTAILLRYVKDSSGRVIGIRVADQNWGARKVRRHVITKGGTGVSNASNYRAVRVP